MKTVLFLSQRGYEKYHFDQLAHDDYRLVALLDEKSKIAFPEAVKPYFDKIYTIHNASDSKLFSEYTLNEQEVFNTVEIELKINPNPKDFVIICTDEFNMLIAGKLCDRYKIPGNKYKTLINYRDKIQMKKQLDQSGIRVPRFTSFDITKALEDPKKYFSYLEKKLSQKFVIKPIAGVSSIETEIIKEYSMFQNFIKRYEKSSVKLEAEEFIEGTLYHCDGLIGDDGDLFLAASEYSVHNLDFLNGKILASIPLKLEDPLARRIKEFAREAIKALGYVKNPLHMEIFKSEQNELVFLEVAARTPGINITKNYENLFGINFYDANLMLHLSGSIKTIKKPKKLYSFVGIIPKIKGKIQKIHQPNFQSQYHIDWKLNVGDTIKNNSNSLIDTAASFIVINEDYRILREDFEYLQEYKALEME